MPGPADFYREIGKSIFRARKPKMSQEKLAVAVGLSRASIVNIERGRHRLQLHVLCDIAAALGVPPQELLPATSNDGATLPAAFKAELSANELVAVGRVLKSGKGAPR
jgi:transcriptional regulator with XRE-family HTH domain